MKPNERLLSGAQAFGEAFAVVVNDLETERVGGQREQEQDEQA